MIIYITDWNISKDEFSKMKTIPYPLNPGPLVFFTLILILTLPIPYPLYPIP